MKRISMTLAATLGAMLSIGARTASATPLDDMISPISNPVTFEDPRHSTELRPLYVYHALDNKFVTGGGHAQVYALQARFKLTDDLSFIATKDGIVRLAPDGVVPDDTGFANLAGGFKYSFYQCDSTIATAGLRYEAPTGEKEVLQGNGDGIINPFVTLGATSDGWNFLLQNGFRFRIDKDDSSFYDMDAHISYKLGNFYPLVEFGVIRVISDGDRLPIADEGQDFFNIGSSNSLGENIVTATVGARYRVTDNVDVGAAYQFPLNRSDGTRIIDYRLTADAIVRF